MKKSVHYPEASASFRLSYGAIKNIQENELDNKLEVFTDMDELFKFGDTKSSFSIPESWMKSRSHVNLTTKLNMITTNDCIGGNSGSPMLNKNKKLVGLAFDGNKYRLSGNYFYDKDKNRTIAVSVEAIIEALTKIYKTKRINQELKISR